MITPHFIGRFDGQEIYEEGESSVPHDLNPKAQRAAIDGKPRLELLDPTALIGCADALAHGAAKYGVKNYVKVPINVTTYVGAILRHTLAWAAGSDEDADSGLSHLSHIEACVHVLQAAAAAGTLVDDRGFCEAIEPASAAANQEGGEKLSPGVVDPHCHCELCTSRTYDEARPFCGLAARDNDPDKGCPGLQTDGI